MRKKLVAFCAYVLFWLVFFFFARFFFIITHFKEAFQFGFGEIALTFTHGLKLDLSAATYILVLPFFASVIHFWIKGNWLRTFVLVYTWIILLISTAIYVGDSNLYRYWGFRMDYTPLLYLSTPQEAAASVTTLTIIIYCIVVAVLTLFSAILYKKSVDRFFRNLENPGMRLPATVIFLLILGSFIIPMRGGLGVAPVNAGSVYFSEHLFINHSAINVFWNVGSSIYNRKPSYNPYSYGDPEISRGIVRNLTMESGTSEKVLNNQSPNILLIILESFGDIFVGPLGGDSLVTPCINKLVDEGITFSNFYASGNRTDKALPAILNGYPAQPATSIIKEPRKTQSLPSLVRIMDSLNYRTSFWYGGDIDFANFNSFVLASGFKQTITMKNFDPKNYNSKWGVHDHILFEALKDSMRSVREPFFRVVLTLSSHEPFEIPVEPVFKGRDELTRFKNSVHYTDSTLGRFIDWAKGTQWWKNTLVIIVADHCRRNSSYDLVFSPEIFKIPMLWIGGAVKDIGRKVDKLGTQVDIPETVLSQLDIHGNFPFSKDLLSSGSRSFAFYVFNEGFAFLTDSSTLIFDHKLGKPVLKAGKNPEQAEAKGKAYLQVLYDDYMRR